MSVNKIHLATENNIIRVIDNEEVSVKLNISNDDFERKLRLIGIIILIFYYPNNNIYH